jgi:hypothetical protein
MKKIDNYRTLLAVDKSVDLKTLKTAYRNVMKEWHPDKFHADPDAMVHAEQKSAQLIEAYHFLVSIAPETVEHNMPHYMETITTATITDYQYKGQTLQIHFQMAIATNILMCLKPFTLNFTTPIHKVVLHVGIYVQTIFIEIWAKQ